MLTKPQADRAIALHEWVKPLLLDEPLLAQRLVLVKLAVDWLLQHEDHRQEWLDSLKLGIEMRLAGRMGDDV